MTHKEKLTNNLIKFNEKFTDKGDAIIIKSYSPIITMVSFENETININSKLTGWNFLTGFVSMKFEKVLNYVSIMMIIGVAVLTAPIFLSDGKIKSSLVFLYTIIILIVIIWTLLFYLNYRIQYENIKNRIIEWTK